MNREQAPQRPLWRKVLPLLDNFVGRLFRVVSMRRPRAGASGRVDAPMKVKPTRMFSVGQRVRVILNESNRTSHTGIIRRKVYHHKYEQFFYLI
jgi:hypothetical protein